MAQYLPYYGFPDDMSGKRVLDVGRASGFFSLEFERRGADVTATEVASVADWDSVGGESEYRRRMKTVDNVETFVKHHITGAFLHAHTILKSRVKLKTLNVYGIKPEEFEGGPFDLVFAGSITSHLRDPILGLERLRSVTLGTCIIAAPALLVMDDQPLMALVGTKDSDRRSWWMPNKTCLIEMLHCAGFSKAEIVSEFHLAHRKWAGQKVPHIVAHAWP